MTDGTWFLDQDSDCHWFRIPVARRAEWEAWRDLDAEDEEADTVPGFAIPLSGHPRLFEFLLPGG